MNKESFEARAQRWGKWLERNRPWFVPCAHAFQLLTTYLGIVKGYLAWALVFYFFTTFIGVLSFLTLLIWMLLPRDTFAKAFTQSRAQAAKRPGFFKFWLPLSRGVDLGTIAMCISAGAYISATVYAAGLIAEALIYGEPPDGDSQSKKKEDEHANVALAGTQ